MTYLLLFTLIFLVLYSIQILLFIYGFLNIKAFKTNNELLNLKDKKYLTIIIPFKNEETKLKQLISNIKKQSLNSKYFEVLLINDNSTDNSYKILNKEIKNIDSFKLLNLSKSTGKKNAIKEGIKASNTNIIVTTDADCIHKKYWLETILKYYLKNKPKMIIAPVLMTGKSFFQKLQKLEFLSLSAATAGATGIKHPIMCNGANLIYEKKVFLEFEDALNMYEISGDDIFLMHNVKKKYTDGIHYLKSADVIVYTEAEKSIKHFFKQRLRWASKSKSYKDFDTIFSSILVFNVNILFIVLLFLSFFYYNYFITLFIFWSIKFSIDIVLLIIAGKYFRQFPNISYLFLVSLLYPFYIGVTAISSFFVKSFFWKE